MEIKRIKELVEKTLATIKHEDVPVEIIEDYLDDTPAVRIDKCFYLYYGEYDEVVKSIFGKERRKGEGFTLEVEYSISNYPHAPDEEDVKVLSRSISIVLPLGALAHNVVENRLNGYLEHLEYELDLEDQKEYFG